MATTSHERDQTGMSASHGSTVPVSQGETTQMAIPSRIPTVNNASALRVELMPWGVFQEKEAEMHLQS